MLDKQTDYMKSVLGYYRDCIKEEAKTSAFRNIKSSKSTIYLKLQGKEKLFAEYPTALEPSEQVNELTDLLVQRELDKTRQLVYGYLFVKDEVNRKQVYTPLFYIPVEIARLGTRVMIEPQSAELILNISAISEYIDVENAEPILEGLLSNVPSLPLSDEDTQDFLSILHQYLPEIPVQQEKGLILANIPLVTASMLNDMDKIMGQISYSNTALYSLQLSGKLRPDENEVVKCSDSYAKVPASLIPLSNSQEEVIDAVKTNEITAVIGGPGCGKSHTILGLITHLLANNKTVLVASKMNEAVDVVYKELEELGSSYIRFAARTGNKQNRLELAQYLEDVASGKVIARSHENFGKANLEMISEKEELLTKCKEYKEEYERLTKLADSYHYNNMLYKIAHLGSYLKVSRDRDKNENDCNKTLDRLNMGILSEFPNQEDLVRSVFWNTIAKNYERSQQDHYRKSLLSLAKALRAKPSKANREAIEHFFGVLLSQKILPCWCTTIEEVSSSIPCLPGYFDVVIIDEASQCDIASSIPLLYRAKQAIIVGDDKQLKFLSFLDNRKNIGFMESNSIADYDKLVLDYKKNSLFDFASYMSNTTPIMLKEHFRSKASSLIEFSNKKFYNGQLICVNNNVNSFTGVDTVYTTGDVSPKKTVNYKEAEEIVADIIYQVRATKEKQVYKSIGVVTPFRAQADLINNMLMKQLTLDELKDYKILVGTAHAFQGSEKDLIYVSWAVSKNSHVQSFTFINNPNLFNVTITRAKYKVKNYISMNIKDIPNGLLREYLEYHKKSDINTDISNY